MKIREITKPIGGLWHGSHNFSGTIIKEFLLGDGGFLGKGIYFTDKKDVAVDYAAPFLQFYLDGGKMFLYQVSAAPRKLLVLEERDMKTEDDDTWICPVPDILTFLGYDFSPDTCDPEYGIMTEEHVARMLADKIDGICVCYPDGENEYSFVNPDILTIEGVWPVIFKKDERGFMKACVVEKERADGKGK